MASVTSRVLLAPFVLGLFALQVLSYAALLAVFSVHGEVTPVVATLRGVPTPVLVALSIPAIPAVAVSVVLAEGLRIAAGISPFGLGTVLLAPGDALVFLAAYLVAVGVVVARRRLSRPRDRQSD